jgi:hypothetical protein
MKYLLFVLLLPLTVIADQRFETVGGFCHFVTPEGFRNANDDNEVFFANCLNSIRQNEDGTGDGSTVVKVKYPEGALPFTESYETSGAETGIDCVMVDSNNTQYVTQDWNSKYKPKIKDLKDFQKAFGTQEGDEDYDRDFDFNEDGVINSLDTGIFKQTAKGEIEYSITCRNGAQN